MRLAIVLLVTLACVSSCKKKQAYKVDSNFVGVWQSNVSQTEGYRVVINDGWLGSSYEYNDLKNSSPNEEIVNGTARVYKKKNLLIIGEKELTINQYPEFYLDTVYYMFDTWRMILDNRTYYRD